jgi:hypothetical protein
MLILYRFLKNLHEDNTKQGKIKIPMLSENPLLSLRFDLLNVMSGPINIKPTSGLFPDGLYFNLNYGFILPM